MLFKRYRGFFSDFPHQVVHAIFTKGFIRRQQALNEAALFITTLAAFHVGIPEMGKRYTCSTVRCERMHAVKGMGRINNGEAVKIIVLIDQFYHTDRFYRSIAGACKKISAGIESEISQPLSRYNYVGSIGARWSA